MSRDVQLGNYEISFSHPFNLGSVHIELIYSLCGGGVISQKFGIEAP